MDEGFCGSAFWDLNETSDTNATGFPDLTKCFQITVLVWIPCGYLLTVAPFYIWSLVTSPRSYIRHTWLNVTKTVLCLLLAILSMVDFAHKLREFVNGESPYPAHVLAPFLTFLAMSTALLLIQFGRTRGVRVTGFLFLYWLLQFISAVFILQSNIRTAVSVPEDLMASYSLVHACIFTLLVSISVVLSGCFVDCPGKQSEYSGDLKECPESSACFISILSFWWFNPLVMLVFKQLLTKADLWLLNPENRSKSVVPHFEKYWKKELRRTARSRNDFSDSTQDDYGNIILRSLNSKDEKVVGAEVKFNNNAKGSSPPRLWRALVLSFWRIFVFSALLKFLRDVLLFVSAFLLKALISFVDDPTEPAWRGYTYAALMFVVTFVQSLIQHQFMHRCMTTGMRMRTALITSIYKKSLLLSNEARKTSTVGEIVNLMSVDAHRFTELALYLNMVWSFPFQICVCLYFLWMVLGPSVLAGVAVMVLMIPINAVIAKKLLSLKVIRMKHTDSRIKLMNEVLNRIKVLKLYAWEPPFEQKILDIRSKELLVLRRQIYLNAAFTFTWTCAPFLV